MCTHFSVVQSPAGFERVERWDHLSFTEERILTYIGTRYLTNTQSVVLVRPRSLLRNLSVGVGSHVQSEEKINRCHFLWHQWYDFTILHHFFQNFLSGGATYTTQWLSLDYIQRKKFTDNQGWRDAMGFWNGIWSIFMKVFILGTAPTRLLRIPKYHTNVSIISKKGTHKCIHSRIKFCEAISSFWKLLSHCGKIFVKCNANKCARQFWKRLSLNFSF